MISFPFYFFKMYKKILFFIFINFVFINFSYADFQINEIFPNTSDDTIYEYFSIKNNWNSSSNISWYSIFDKSWKEYFFEDYDFTKGESKNYFRSESKILLNNSNEELYLKNSFWEIVDTWVYEKSEKNIIYKKDINNVITSLENLNYLVSDNDDNIVIPNVKYAFQNPSYLLNKDQNNNDFWTEQIIYYCDKNYDECKINLNYKDSFYGDYKESDFLCETDFWLWDEIWEENKCNPSTVIFPIWDTEINIKIIEKNNIENYRNLLILVKNDNEYDSIIDDDKELDNNDNDDNSQLDGLNESCQYWLNDDSQNIDINNCDYNDWNLDNWIIDDNSQENNIDSNIDTDIVDSEIGVPELKIWFQNPSYLTNKEKNFSDFWDDNIIYYCDKKYDECKINLNYKNSFYGDYKESSFLCETDFWLWYETWEENKCNPWTINIPIWNFKIGIKLIDKNDSNNFRNINLFINNPEYFEDEKSINNSNLSWNIYIPRIKVDVQSWAEKTYSKVYRNYFTCDKKVCSVNLNYEKYNKNLSCKWRFRDWIFNKWTGKKCNPSSVKYWPWLHKLKLIVYNKKNKINSKTEDIFVNNLYVPEKLHANIYIQGVLTKNKLKFWDNIYCVNSEECSINFSPQNSTWEIEKYIWEFSDGEIYEWKNPPNHKFTKWKNDITLKIYDTDWNINSKNFTVNVLDKNLSQDEFLNILDKNKSFLSIKEDKLLFKNFLLEHNIKFDDNDISDNIFTETLRKNKNSVTVYWKTSPWNTVMFDVINKENIFTKKDAYKIVADESWKYSLNIKNKYLWNYEVKSFLVNKDEWKLSTNILKKFTVENEELPDLINNDWDSLISDNKINEIKKIIISLQWKIGTNKKLEWNKLTCIWTCSVNFDWSETTWNFIKYIWDFWNWEIFEWINPGYINYKKFWNYKITFTGIDSFWEKYFKYFYVNFIPKFKKINNTKNNENKSDKITKKSSENLLENTKEINIINLEKNKLNIYLTLFIIILSIFLWSILMVKKKIISF